MSASVCALIEKGTSWTRLARLVAVTMISPPCGSSLGATALGPGFAACAASSDAVCAKAGVLSANSAVPISSERAIVFEFAL